MERSLLIPALSVAVVGVDLGIVWKEMVVDGEEVVEEWEEEEIGAQEGVIGGRAEKEKGKGGGTIGRAATLENLGFVLPEKMSRAASAKEVLKEELKKLEDGEKRMREDLEENLGMQAQFKQMLGGKLNEGRELLRSF